MQIVEDRPNQKWGSDLEPEPLQAVKIGLAPRQKNVKRWPL
jgi:hypothetical protein